MNTIKLISTGQIILGYMEANNITIADLAAASDVSPRTVYRLFNDEIKVPVSIAEGLHSLISEIPVVFILEYDAKYQYQKEQEQEELNLSKKQIDGIISKFQLRKLFPAIATDKIKLIEKAIEVFGFDKLVNYDVDSCMSFVSSVQFSKAKNPDDFISKVWLVNAYAEASNRQDVSEFDYEVFIHAFNTEIRKLCFANSIDIAKYNMSDFCSSCGINFYFRPSIPNSRIKGVTIKDSQGRIYVILSDLFKCVENLWLTFIHEMLHIAHKDIYMTDYQDADVVSENEQKIDDEVIKFLVKDRMDESREYSFNEIIMIAAEEDIPKGIVAEIARFKSNTYNNYDINSLIHYFK